MSLTLAVLIIAAAINISIGLVVLQRDSKKPAHIAFALTSFSLVCWAALNFLSAYLPPEYTLTITRLTGLFGFFLITNFYILSTVFPNSRPPRLRFKKGLIVVGSIVAVLCLTSFFIQSAVNTNGGLKLTEGVLYPLYPLYAVVLFILCNVNFVRQYRHARKYARTQIELMWTGIVLTVGFIMMSNIIMPAVTSDWSSSSLGTVFTLPFVFLTAYAIIKRRMFDIRLVVSRTIAYVITIGIAAALYTLIITVITTRLAPIGELTGKQVAILLIPTVFIALTFHSLQQLIDRYTKRMFYRDAYELRDVLDQMSDALLSENDIAVMMRKSLTILADALKPTTAYFAVLNSSGGVYKHFSFGKEHVTDIAPYLARISHEKPSIIESDDKMGPKLSQLMARDEVELLLRLGPKDAPIGVLLLGLKHNGSMYTDQDISVLRISAKNLAIALDNAKKYEQIIHFADTMHKEVNRATARLRKANTELKSLDALKDDFISTASHQLRTPSASVHDALRMLNSPAVDDEDRKELTRLAEASSEHLVTVVRTMLNMARLQAGHFTIDKSETELVGLTEKVIDQVTVVATQKDSTITFNRPAGTINVKVDVAKINEALSNYLENAIKYSPEHSTITVDLTQENGWVSYEIADQGMGVPPKERDSLFGKFYRATNARQEQPDGNGIGLYVVKSIAEGHGGEAYYKPAPEQGSIFGLRIPVSVTGRTK